MDLTIMDGQAIAREYKSQRLGIFKHNHNIKDNRFKFVFQSKGAPMEVYFSY